MTKKLLTVRITENKLAKFREYCDGQGLSMSEIINDFIDSVVEDKELSPIDNDRQPDRQLDRQADRQVLNEYRQEVIDNQTKKIYELNERLNNLESKYDRVITETQEEVKNSIKRIWFDQDEIASNTDNIHCLTNLVLRLKTLVTGIKTEEIEYNYLGNRPYQVGRTLLEELDNKQDYRQPDRQNDRQNDRQPDRQLDRQPDRQPDNQNVMDGDIKDDENLTVKEIKNKLKVLGITYTNNMKKAELLKLLKDAR